MKQAQAALQVQQSGSKRRVGSVKAKEAFVSSDPLHDCLPGSPQDGQGDQQQED